MKMTIFRKTISFSPGRILLWTIALAIVFGIGMFVRQTYIYYRAIKNGEAIPILERQMEYSASRIRANAAVTAQDLEHVGSPLAPKLGAQDAKVAIVEFLDYGCSFSRDSAPVVRRVAEKYHDRVSLSVRDFPIEDLHPRAMADAVAARCAQDQGKFWVFHDRLFANQSHQEDADLLKMAADLGLNQAAFKTCFESRKTQPTIEQDMRDALRLGVDGTPAFFFNGVKVQGAMDEETFEYLINLFLKESTIKK